MERGNIRADGGIGIRDSLRSYWGNPWRFKSSSAQIEILYLAIVSNAAPRADRICAGAHFVLRESLSWLERNRATVDVAGSTPVSRFYFVSSS